MFVWESPEGVKITMPSVKTVKSGMLRRHRSKSEIDFMYSLLEDLLDESTLAQVDELNMTDTEALFGAWQKDAGIGVGESSGSST